MLSQSDDAESERKRLLALLLEGTPVVVIDNVERPLRSDTLCSILTEPLFADRVLGVSRTACVPTNAMFCATGNNIAIHGDLSSRALVCALDPKCERPEERRFAVNLHETVPARRGELGGGRPHHPPGLYDRRHAPKTSPRSAGSRLGPVVPGSSSMAGRAGPVRFAAQDRGP